MSYAKYLIYSLTVFGRAGEPDSYDVNQSTIDALFGLVDGFLLSITVRGQIVLVSSSIEQYLGHCQVCMRIS